MLYERKHAHSHPRSCYLVFSFRQNLRAHSCCASDMNRKMRIIFSVSQFLFPLFAVTIAVRTCECERMVIDHLISWCICRRYLSSFVHFSNAHAWRIRCKIIYKWEHYTHCRHNGAPSTCVVVHSKLNELRTYFSVGRRRRDKCNQFLFTQRRDCSWHMCNVHSVQVFGTGISYACTHVIDQYLFVDVCRKVEQKFPFPRTHSHQMQCIEFCLRNCSRLPH